MREKAQAEKMSAGTWGHSQVLRRIALAALVTVVLSGSLFFSYFLITRIQRAQQSADTIATNGAARWVGDTQTTAPSFEAPAANVRLAVDPFFQEYYTSEAAAPALGAPLTAAFPVQQGWIQFFVSGALLLPKPGPQAQSGVSAGDGEIAELIGSSLVDAATGVVRLPLIQALLTVGSQVPLGGEGSALTYVDLRAATDPARMVPAPAQKPSPTTSQLSAAPGEVFVAGGTRGGKTVGHLIPAVIWSYITRADVSPRGWMNDFGAPLTEALAFTMQQSGSVHHLLAQVFWRNVVLLDQGVQGAASQPTFITPTTGLDYLRTLGPPRVEVGSHTSVWARGETALLSAAGTGQATVHVGQHFPLTLSGGVSWVKGALWYEVLWNAPETSGKGWAPASALSFTSPGNVPGWASFDVLSPDLARYLASLGGTVGAVVYDVTRQRYYTYNKDGRFIAGSAIKVPVMLAFLHMVENEGRQPTADEMCLLTEMIEHSRNESVMAFFYGFPDDHCGPNFETIGGANGLAGFMEQIGISGLEVVPDAVGYSIISPMAMVRLLALLQAGKVLTAQDRNLALYLMEHIQTDQRAGVGDTAPEGATVAMKDGWVRQPGPGGPETGPWTMNSSGIVMLGAETYIIAVYSAEHNTLLEGQNVARHVCSVVASALT